ncbi:hypothetical protein PMAYCL1PPCAC_18541, partial [Pristionchus mayeri]
DLIMLAYTYRAVCELNELSVDDIVTDYAYLSDENFLLVALLTSKGNVQIVYEVGCDRPRKRLVSIPSIWGRPIDPVALCIGPEAAFLALALSDGDILVVPMKLLLDVAWGATNLLVESSSVLVPVCSSANLVLRTPTSILSFVSRTCPTPILVYSNKAGQVLIVDLLTRKLTIEVQAPESVHKIDVFQSTYGVDLLVTSFTGAQWVVPLENGERGLRETLGVLIPSDLKALEPASAVVSRCGEFVTRLNTETNDLDLFSSTRALINQRAAFDEQSFGKLVGSTRTMSVSVSGNTLFCLTNNNRVSYKLRFGLPFNSLNGEGSSWVGVSTEAMTEWPSLGMIPLRDGSAFMPEALIINERGIVRITPDNGSDTVGWLAESILYSDFPTPGTLKEAGEHLSAGSSHAFINRVLNLLLDRFSKAKQTYVAGQLTKIVTIAKNQDMSFDDLVALMEKFKLDHLLLPQMMARVESNGRDGCRKRVLPLVVRSVESKWKTPLEADCILSPFLCRQPDLKEGLSSLLSSSLWRSAALLLPREHSHSQVVLSFLIAKGPTLWKDSDGSTRSLILCLVWPLKWDLLNADEISSFLSLLTQWLADLLNDVSALSKCARIGSINIERCDVRARILFIVASLLALSSPSSHSLKCPPSSMATGLSSSLVYGVDRSLVLWGDLSSVQRKTIEEGGVNGVARRSLPSTPTHSIGGSIGKIDVSSLEVHSISVGVEHVLLLSSDGRLFSWGTNKYGQCGVGHTLPLQSPTQVDGDWSSVLSLCAGQYHSAVLIEEEREEEGGEGQTLFTWGWGMYGQLGHGEEKDRNGNKETPKRVKLLPCVARSVHCGRVHTALLSMEGEVWVVGGGAYGQLGTTDDRMKSFHWIKIELGEGVGRVRLMSTKFYHNLVVTEENRLFEWGKNPQELKMKMFVMRRLRNAKDAEKRARPALPTSVPKDFLGVNEIEHEMGDKIVEVSSGLSHCAAVTEKGELFTWGKNLDYQLGLGHKVERSDSTRVSEPEGVVWSGVHCGGNHSMGVSSDGRLWSWGRNDANQCAVVPIKAPSGARKFFFQAKEGAKKCVQLADDSTFVTVPTLVPTLTLHQSPKDTDRSGVMDALISLDVSSCLSSSRFLSSLPSTASPSLATLHLMAGEMLQAINCLSATEGQIETPSALISLIWEMVSNHEDCHTRTILTAAFSLLPRTPSTVSNRQVRALWPGVWDEEGTQRGLGVEERVAMMGVWNPARSTPNYVLIPSSTLPPSSSSSSTTPSTVPSGGVSSSPSLPRSRLFPTCLHVVPLSSSSSSTPSSSLPSALPGTVPQHCPVCIEEWKQLLADTLS